MPAPNQLTPDAASVAAELAGKLDAMGVDYAVGDAIALGFWSEPRGTLDVDVTLLLPESEYRSAVDILQQAGCDVARRKALESIEENGLCRVSLHGVTVDVFLPTLSFFDQAHDRRVRVTIDGKPLFVWTAEVVAVLKMMFFRGQDLVDVEKMMRFQGSGFDRNWVRERLVEIFGLRDPRIPAWDELVARTPVE
jgi:hypothetical protein